MRHWPSLAGSIIRPRVLTTAAAVASLTFIFINGTVYTLNYAGVEGDQLQALALLAGGPAATAVFAALTLWLGWLLARSVGTHLVAHAGVMGILAALLLQLLFLLLAPPVWLSETLIYVVLGTIFGVAAGLIARRSLAAREAVYRSVRDVKKAHGADEIAAAIGTHMGSRIPRTVGVCLWRRSSSASTSGELLRPWGAWAPAGRPTVPLDAELSLSDTPGLSRTLRGEWVLLRTRRLPPPQRERWSRHGVALLLAAPLVTALPEEQGTTEEHLEQEHASMLTVAFARGSRLSAGLRTDYLTLAEEAASALERMRHLKRERQDAKQIGEAEERGRILREIHDTTKGALSGISWLISACLESVGPDDARTQLRENLELIRRETDDALESHQRFIGRRRRPANGEPALHASLRDRAQRWSSSSGVAVSFATAGRPTPIPEGMHGELAAILREALTNVAKHAEASRVRITLAYEGARLRLIIADNGAGFDPSEARRSDSGFGLKSMDERAGVLGGSLSVRSAPGVGTTITLEAPTASRPGSPHDTLPTPANTPAGTAAPGDAQRIFAPRRNTL